ncbi:hypothetical protein FisN_3Lu037 [Fistulifera solaris]|uniref:Leucine-rich repeat-containing N-terminal plant-type domain-containing protein n=1 Tax=Fistulifera solaris TaxID=1519565 RepID=A0A1Z5JYV8_FISSO|nr:hypothetical protein FisN_3Lu037 [Fistulifera solaris]|eukprot:GAX19099.1 hypothetical protein FisN_3Lu037 [Fistulifera solaris]
MSFGNDIYLVLAVFYFAIGGERWKACGEGRPRNWLNQDVLECQWIGVFCDATGAIIRLDFESARVSTVDSDSLIDLHVSRIRLDGEFRPELRLFTYLEEFLATNMDIQGSLDAFEVSTQLRILNVENNVLTGTISSELDTIHPFLEVFNVRSNNLTGSLPNVLAKLETCKYFTWTQTTLLEQFHPYWGYYLFSKRYGYNEILCTGKSL